MDTDGLREEDETKKDLLIDWIRMVIDKAVELTRKARRILEIYDEKYRKWYRGKGDNQKKLPFDMDKDRYEISHISEANGRPLEAQENIMGLINASIDMKTFNDGKGSHKYSAQFIGTNMLQWNY